MTADPVLSKVFGYLQRPFYNRLTLHPAPTINGLHGGHGGPGTKTVRPCTAAKCNIDLAQAHGAEPILYSPGFGSLPGAAFTRILGIPAFAMLYANAASANHVPDGTMTLHCSDAGMHTRAALLHAPGRAGAPG